MKDLKNESVLILHNQPPENESGHIVWRESNAGVLVEVSAVSAALTNLGMAYRVKGISAFAELPDVLKASRERIVFNLIEGFHEQAVNACYVPALCQAFGKVCTGSESPCLFLSLDKWKTKILLQSAGLSCPLGFMVPIGGSVKDAASGEGSWIVKPLASDASEGISPASVVRGGAKALAEVVRKIHEEQRQPALVERFIDGREFNVALLQKDGEVRPLPVAEIDFSAFGPDRPRIVDYAAKWLADSFEYKNTPRKIPASLKPELAEAIQRAALAAWDALGCADYARVDFRLTEKEEPLILEVNANPDISPDAGFAAALTAAEISYDQFVTILMKNARRRLSERATAAPAAPSPGQPLPKIQIRRTEPKDREPILSLLAATGFFRPNEMDIAKEVLDEALAKGATGHYQSFAAEENGEAVGWVCFGPTPCTLCTFDIYWVGVAPRKQRNRLGSVLMSHAESLIKERGGHVVVIETSGRPTYDATRRFYGKLGYQEAARLADFYAPGDDKVIYTKTV